MCHSMPITKAKWLSLEVTDLQSSGTKKCEKDKEAVADLHSRCNATKMLIHRICYVQSWKAAESNKSNVELHGPIKLSYLPI